MAKKRRSKKRPRCALGCHRPAKNYFHGKHICSKNPYLCPKILLKKQHTWLDWMNVPRNEIHREVRIYLDEDDPTYYITADAYLPPKGNDKHKGYIYEFWGDYWHGNPKIYDEDKTNVTCQKKMSELLEETQRKIERILEAGYFLIDIWEYDWKRILKGSRPKRKKQGKNRLTFETAE